MRIVLDTNIVVSALLWRGPSYRLLQAIHASPEAQLIASAPLIEELAEVLARPHCASRYALIGKTPAQVLADYLEAVALVEPASITARSVDPDDDLVLATALGASADLIVSGDADLLNLKHFHGIDIVNVSEAIQRVERAPHPPK